jgi:succinyl-diaminopimelate desuccinylase
MNSSDIHENVDRDFDDMLSVASKVIEIPSVLDENAGAAGHPFGSRVTEALDVFLGEAKKRGFTTFNIDNMVGYAEIGEGPLFGILAHLDVMPAGALSNWRHPPFRAVVEDGRLYGRGAMDDKAPAVGALFALKALADSGVKLNRRFRLIVGLDEESGFRCIERYKKTEEIPAMSFSPDADFPVVNSEKGILNFILAKKISNMDAMGLPELINIMGGDRFNMVPDELDIFFKRASAGNLELVLAPISAQVAATGDGVSVKVYGKSAHAMEPHKGENAVQKFLSAVENMDFGPPCLHAELLKLAALFKNETDGASLGVACEDDVSGALTCNLASISLDGGRLSVKCDIRYPVKKSGDSLVGTIRNSAEEIGWELEVKRRSEPLYVEPEGELVRVLLASYADIAKGPAAPQSIGGGTYCKALPNAVSFGPLFPGDEETSHQPDEYIRIDSLRKMTHVYAEALSRFNSLA